MFAEKMDAFVCDYCKTHNFSGALRVSVGGKTIYERGIGYADIEKKLSFESDTLFSFYSMTKPFTAIGIMLLVDKGLVSLDAHPSLYVPEAAGFDGRVTVRHLLQHISGLPDFEQDKEFAKKYAPGTPEKVRRHLELIADFPMMFAPGTADFYANVNYTILALIIENVSGMQYADYMKKRVFEPLGAKSAYIDSYNAFTEGGAVGYEQAEGGLRPIHRGLDWMLGAGDMVGTLDDAYTLNLAVKNRLLLSEKSWELVLTPTPINDMGFGCRVTVWHGKKRITHNGGHLGFRTLHVHLPEDDFDIILLSNCGFGGARTDFSEAIYDAYYGASGEAADNMKMDAGYI